MTADQFPFPILDLSEVDKGPGAAARFRDQLRTATHDVGFFYLVGTGVTPSLEARLLSVSREFFALPVEEKLKIENIKSPGFRGYTRLGGERTQGKVDWREMIDIWPEREALPASELTSLPSCYRLIGPNLWPEALPELRSIITEWQAILDAAAHKLLRAWALALGAEEDFFDRHFADPTTRLKIVRYPGVAADDADGVEQGVGAHKDGGCVTLLWVEPGVGGLQIKPNEDAEWIDAPNPNIPGAFICNIGEMIEYATQGYLKATVHRVVPPRAPKERISVPMFFNPSLNARFPVINLPPELAKDAKGVTQDPDNVIYSLYGDNLLKSRLRAHPNVAAIHHPDLVASG